MRGKNKRRSKARDLSDDAVVLRKKPHGGESSRHVPTAHSGDQMWAVMPPRNIYNEFSILCLGDDLQPYMKTLLYEGAVLEPQSDPRST